MVDLVVPGTYVGAGSVVSEYVARLIQDDIRVSPELPPAPGIAVREDGRLVFASDTPEGAQRVAIE